MEYSEFLKAKLQSKAPDGIKKYTPNPMMYGFQAFLTEWALLQGRGALLCDCGLGKSLMLLDWAQKVVEHTNKPVLIVTPLAVSSQTVREGNKFDIEVKRSNDGKVAGKITVTNYEKLDKFNWQDYSGIVCDESSRIKSQDAKTRKEVTEFMRKIPFRLLTTATAAPNDYLELGTSSEALGYLGFMDMLNKFFKNDSNNSAMRRMYGEAPKWRFRGHAEVPFWRWVCSWARAMRKPSDLGFDDTDFVLPLLTENEHIVEAETLAPGMLFAMPAKDLREQREERKRTINERSERVMSLVNNGKQSMIWCHLNEEGDTLQRMIPGSVQISGRDNDDKKEEKFLAFIDGEIENLITKPKIGAWGLNLQNCSHMVTYPSHSYEQFYQCVRRFWRFGQKEQVTVDVVMTEGERKVVQNMQRKAKQATAMFDNLCQEMNHAIGISNIDRHQTKMEAPTWK